MGPVGLPPVREAMVGVRPLEADALPPRPNGEHERGNEALGKPELPREAVVEAAEHAAAQPAGAGGKGHGLGGDPHVDEPDRVGREDRKSVV